MISRVADYCFWFGRYLERAESSARLLDATRSLVFDADIPVTQCWAPLVIVSGEEQAFVERYDRASLGNGEVVQEYMTWNRENLVSLSSSVRGARECARAIREQLSLDTWEEINELYLWLSRDTTQALYWNQREEFYRVVRRGTQLILGLVRSTMLHEDAMRFLWLGAMIERVGQTARILDMHHHTMSRESSTHAHDIVQTALWMSLLRACSGSEAFMKKNQGRVTAQSMVQFLLLSPAFPRSLAYCLKSSKSILECIWEEPLKSHASAQSLTALLSWLEHKGVGLELSDIHSVLTHVVDETALICSLVSKEIQGPERVMPSEPVEEVVASTVAAALNNASAGLSAAATQELGAQLQGQG